MRQLQTARTLSRSNLLIDLERCEREIAALSAVGRYKRMSDDTRARCYREIQADEFLRISIKNQMERLK
jgi:hypothetical protein